jgi:hypothetical protein
MPVAVVFLDMKKAFDITWQLELISSFQQKIQSYGWEQTIHASIYPTWGAASSRPGPCPVQSVYKEYSPKPRVDQALFTDDTRIYRTDRKEVYVLRTLQRCLTKMESRCERWNITINEDKTQTIYVSHRRRPVEAYLTLKRRQTPFVKKREITRCNLIKKITWRLHTETTAVKALRTFIRIYPFPKSVNTKLTIYKALIKSIMTYACPSREFGADHTDPPFACDVQKFRTSMILLQNYAGSK